MFFLFLLHLLQMQGEILICKGNVLVIPPVVPCFSAAEEQDRAAIGIESKQYAHRIAFELDSQLLHVLVRRALNVVNPGLPKFGPTVFSTSR